MISLPDLSDQHSKQIQIGKLALHSFGSRHSISGEIYTVSCSDDNSVVKEVLSREGKNKVLVIDASGVNHASMIGDQIAKSAVKNNWAGIVVNGCIRDVEELKNLPIGIFAKGVVAQKTNKENHGFEDVLISFGSVVMTSGKWIYIDQNGWLVADNKLEL
jgi:regulator of ribonuclease activity A